MSASPFPAVAAQPDLPAQEHRIARLLARARASSRSCAPRTPAARTWSFLDGPITANNPMGVHHAWGRTYKDLYQRYHAMLGQDQRWQNGFDCQGLWVEVNVERELGFTSKRDIETFGIAEFVRLCKQRVLTYAAVQTEQSIRLGYVDGLERPRRAAPPARPARARTPTQVITVDGPARSGHGHRRDDRRPPGPARAGRLLLHLQQREQRPHLGLPGRVRPARLAVQGPRRDALVRALRHGHEPDGDERGLPGPRGPGAHRALPARRPPRRAPAGVDHDALDADRQRRGGRGRRTSTYVHVEQGDDTLLAGQGDAQDAPSRAPSRCSRSARARTCVGWPYRGPFDDLPAVQARAFAAGVDEPGARPTPTASSPGTRSARRRARASSTSRPAAARRTSSWARSSACRSSRRSTRPATTSTASGRFTGMDAAAVAPRSSRTSRRRGFFYHLEPYTHRYPHCWRCGTALLFRVVDEWYISMGPVYDMPREQLTRGAEGGQPALPDHGRRGPASAGSRPSATSASWTGCARCPTG